MSHVLFFWWGLRDTQPVANCMCRSILLAFLTLNATSWGCSVVPLRRSYADSRCVVVIVTRSEGKKVERFRRRELLGASRVTSTHVIAVHMLLAFTNPKSLVNFLFSKLMSPSTHQIKLPLLPPWVRQCGVFHVTVWMLNVQPFMHQYSIFVIHFNRKGFKVKGDIFWHPLVLWNLQVPPETTAWSDLKVAYLEAIIRASYLGRCQVVYLYDWNPQVLLKLADFLIFKTYEFHQVLLRNLYNMSLDVPLLNNLFTIFKACPKKTSGFARSKPRTCFF